MPSGFVVERVPGIAGITVEWEGPGQVLASRGSDLLVGPSVRGPFRSLARFPAPRWRRWAGRTRLGRRLLRHTYYNVWPIDEDRYFVAFDKQVAVLDRGRWRPVSGARKPFRILRSGAAWDGGNHVFFGEYTGNDAREAVNVYRASCSSAHMEIVWTFPAKEIRHVHGVYRDPLDGAFWICAGDRGDECRLARTRDGFGSVEVVGGGDETWRAVSVEFTETHVYYATDAEFVPNRVYRVDRATGRREALFDVTGTTLATARLGRHIFFATTAEQCPSNPKGQASIWWLDADVGEPRLLASRFRDRFNQTLFQFGQYLFPNRYSRPSSTLSLTAMGLRGPDFATFQLRQVLPA